MENHHIFDILGIGSREDSYSDLIKFAFEKNIKFRNNLLTKLEETEFDGWEIKVRLPVYIKLSTRIKDVPDIVLYNNAINKIIIIENKIFSEEGWEQTIRYSDQNFKKELAKHEDIKLKNPDFKFFFLTLDGKKASSDDFEKITYPEAILDSICNCKLANSKVDILLGELKERIVEYKDWEKPKDNDDVIKYLRNSKRLVDWNRTFFLATKYLVKEESNWYYNHSATGNRGCGFVPLLTFAKKSWFGEEFTERINGDSCYFIHFEFQWNTRDDRLTLYLHYETNPYMTQNEFNAKTPIFIDSYNNKRDNFYDYIKNLTLKKWQVRKYKLFIAKHDFTKEIKFIELKQKINDSIKEVEQHIDKYIKV